MRENRKRLPADSGLSAVVRVDGFFEKRKIKIIKKMKIMRKWEKENGRRER